KNSTSAGRGQQRIRGVHRDFGSEQVPAADTGCVVRERGMSAAARSWVLHLGRLRELRQLPAVPEEARAVFQPGNHLGQDAPGVNP
ncbi:MAG: hypothetical protein ACKO9H_03865, partial [Planctomycetota bacterium]